LEERKEETTGAIYKIIKALTGYEPATVEQTLESVEDRFKRFHGVLMHNVLSITEQLQFR